jgi:hypothetical protein
VRATEQMRREVYERLSDVVRLIRLRTAEVWKEPDALMDQWSRWADGFTSGLYVERVADRVLEHDLRDVSRPASPEQRLLARAAALAVDAAGELMWGDPTRAVVVLAEARRLAGQSSAEPLVSAWADIGKDVQLKLRLHPDGWGWHSWKRRASNGAGASGQVLTEPSDDLQARRFATCNRAERFFARVVDGVVES